MTKLLINVDGGARGNPGPAAIGVVIRSADSKKIKDYKQCLGKATNNEAEYQAAIFALQKAKLLLGKKEAKLASLELRSDSQLLVEQMNGRYKILNERIQLLFLKLWNAKMDFKEVIFQLVPRGENKEADQLVNEALDEENSSSLF
jgi:ribonuclease HI/probable phosphoglycerate mutase